MIAVSGSAESVKPYKNHFKFMAIWRLVCCEFCAFLIDEVTDYLSVSFSAVDALNHFFGPASVENEDVVLQLDRTLADFLRFIDKRVGLKNTLIVFSADNGMAAVLAKEPGIGGAIAAAQVADIKPTRVNRLVHPIDVAPTLSALLGLSPPAAAQGDVLVEVTGK